MALLSSDECKRIVLLIARPDLQVRAKSGILRLYFIVMGLMMSAHAFLHE